MSQDKILIQKEEAAQSLRRTALLGVIMSTIALLGCAISVPMAYNYIQEAHTVMQGEVDFCKSRSGGIWKEVTRTQVSLPKSEALLLDFLEREKLIFF